MKYYKTWQSKVSSEVNLALFDANECTNSDLCVFSESVKIFHVTGILKKNFSQFIGTFFGTKFQNGLPKIIKPFVTGPKHALKLAITRIWNYLPEIITPSVSLQNEYFGVVWITNSSIISYPSIALFKSKTLNVTFSV